MIKIGDVAVAVITVALLSMLMVGPAVAGDACTRLGFGITVRIVVASERATKRVLAACLKRSDFFIAVPVRQ